jgi:hypothetical protein
MMATGSNPVKCTITSTGNFNFERNFALVIVKTFKTLLLQGFLFISGSFTMRVC